MYTSYSIFTLTVLFGLFLTQTEAFQQLPEGWTSSQPQQFVNNQLIQQRQPIAAELQNQVNALSAQLAAANRQLEYFQQQLAQQTQRAQQISQSVQSAPQLAHQLQIPQQAQLLSQPQAQPQQLASPFQQFHQAQQFQQAQPQEQPRVSTLVNDESDQSDLSNPDPRFSVANQPARLNFQQQQQQQQQQQFVQQQHQATSTTASPASIEPSFVAQAQAQPQAQQPAAIQQPQQVAPPANMASPHNPPRNDDKFSIGLGVLSPGYTQKFGNTALDFNQDKNGFSFTLSNNGHNNQVPQVTKATGAQASSN